MNAYSGYRGIMTLQDAIRNSSNPTAVRTAIKLTLPASYAFMTENLSFTTLTNDERDRGGRPRSAVFPRALPRARWRRLTPSFRPRRYHTIAPHLHRGARPQRQCHSGEQERISRCDAGKHRLRWMNELLKNVVRNGTGTGANFEHDHRR